MPASTDQIPVATAISAVSRLDESHRLFTFAPEQELHIGPGQFWELSLPGIGNFPVSTAGSISPRLHQCCIRRAGHVTGALFELPEGTTVGLRGPFGRGFDPADFRNRHALLIAGGLGIAPIRGLLHSLLDEPVGPTAITLLYGARTPEDFLFFDELNRLDRDGDISLHLIADRLLDPEQGSPEFCRIGLLPDLLGDIRIDPDRTALALCGPPGLYRCLMEQIGPMTGIPDDRIFVSLERRMRCGVGLCCHCVTDGFFVCKDGPVFTMSQLRNMPDAL